MSLLDKLSAIEIKPDTRISEADREFCQKHQKAYLEARDALISIKKQWQTIYDAQMAVMETIADSEYTRDRYLKVDGLSTSSLSNKIEILPELFITSLVNYFNGKYHVSVSVEAAKKALLPESPKYDWEKSRTKEYHEKMRDFILRYEDVVEQIFVQLGGRTFEQRALDELKEKCHKFAWNLYHSKAEFEVRNDTIQFTGYACSYDSWLSRCVWKFNDGMRDVLRGLAHFETRQLGYLPKDIAFLVSYDDKCSSSYEFNYEKLKKIRMFKNHRVDVKFASKEIAHQFAEQYLGLVA